MQLMSWHGSCASRRWADGCQGPETAPFAEDDSADHTCCKASWCGNHCFMVCCCCCCLQRLFVGLYYKQCTQTFADHLLSALVSECLAWLCAVSSSSWYHCVVCKFIGKHCSDDADWCQILFGSREWSVTFRCSRGTSWVS